MIEALLDALQRILLAGRGRPVAVAILVLLLLLTLHVETEGPAQQNVAPLGKIGEFLGTPLRASRQALFDGYQRLHPRQPQSNPVTIVAIDEASLNRIGQWPWPRNRTADLIDAIAAHRPAAIGLDIYMPEADQTSPSRVADNLPADDRALAAALRRLPSHEQRFASALRGAPTVLGAAGFDFQTLSTTAGLRSVPIEVLGTGDPLRHVHTYPWVLASLPELQAASTGQAVLSVEMQGGVVRRVPLVVGVNGQLVPGLAMEMLRVATGSTIGVTMGPHGVQSVGVADLVVPTQSAGDVWLHFSKWWSGQARYVSAADVLDGKVAPGMLAGKLVMIGLTGMGLSDQRLTALGEVVPGIEIQAQTIESMFDGRMLLRPWWMKWLEMLLIGLIGGLLIFLVPWADSRSGKRVWTAPHVSMGLLLAGNLLIAALGYIVFVQSAMLFDATAPFIVLSSVMGSLLATDMIEIGRRNAALEKERQRMREAAAKAAGELSAAKRIQLGSLPQAEQLLDGETRFELVALLEPAKDVGGDLYDFFMIDPQRLGFVVGDVSGKGLPASLFMAVAKTLTKAIAKYADAGPGKVAELTNAELAHFNPEALFVTALVGVLDVESGLLSLVNAGHDGPWLMRGDDRPMQVESPPDAGGPPLCMIEDFRYRAQQVQLRPGDLLVMYTDGITEAMNAGGELYGAMRLEAALRNAGTLSVREVVDRIRADVDRHVAGAEPSDDLTLLVIRWTPQTG